MECLSVTQQIINYCKANQNTLFDVEHALYSKKECKSIK